MLPFLEKNGREGDDRCQKKQIVYGHDCIGTESIQGLVQIVHLSATPITSQEYPVEGGLCD